MNKLTKGGLSVLAVGAIATGAGAIWELKNRITADPEEATDVEESNDSDEE